MMIPNIQINGIPDFRFLHVHQYRRLFAPLIAVGIRNWWVQFNGFEYNSDLPALSHQFLRGTITPEATQRFTELAATVSKTAPADLTAFANEYLNVFNTGFHYAFGVAIFAMLISLTIFITNKSKFPDPALKAAKEKAANTGQPTAVQMDPKEVRQRLYALFSVFAVVIFFWFSFHQNGVTLTFFANEYTDLSAISIDLGFTTIKGRDLPVLQSLLRGLPHSGGDWAVRLVEGKRKRAIHPEKIAIGMGIAATAFLLMSIGSQGLPDADTARAMGGLTDAQR